MFRTNRRAVLLCLWAITAPFALAQTGQYSEGGYASRHSVAAGEPINFHIATSRSPFDVDIVDLASPNTVVQKLTGLVSQARDCTGLWASGCNWPVTTTFNVPANTNPGYYAARFPTAVGIRNILFVVRPAVPGSYAPIAVIQPSNTDVAYNRYGGKSVYDSLSSGGQRAPVVSFDRPYDGDAGMARYNSWEARFVAWMKAEGRKFEVITDDDMEAGISLANYKAVLIVGHSEYWTRNAREHLEAYSRSGGHIAIFGGNTMWWQARVDLQTRQMTVYKDAALDPLTGVDNARVTVNYVSWPVLTPENSITGASFFNAGYANTTNFARIPLEQRVPYTVRNAGHWVFAGTGLANGSTFGRSAAGIETDGVIFNTLPNGALAVEGSDGTPLSYQILATMPASDGYATIGFHTNPQGGGVFNGATRDWTWGLESDADIQRMTRNVLDRFSTGVPFAHAPRITPNRAEDLFNTPESTTDYLPGWHFSRFGVNLSPSCAHEGPTGAQLAGTRWTQVFRPISVGSAGVAKAALNIWVNTDMLQRTASFETALVNFVEDRGTEQVAKASLEVMDRPEGRSLRLASYDNGTLVASTAWIVVTPGWHSVQIGWESPGNLVLNVSGTKVTAFNPKSGQRMNALILEFAGSYMTGSVCVDQLQLRDTFAPASASSSTIDASPRTLIAGSNATSAVTVTLVDANGNPLVNGGEAVTMSTTLGTLSSVRDAGDGTYTATLTPGANNGTATISARVNGQLLAATTTVTITGGAVPAAPASLAASAVSPTRIDLSWSDASSDETGFRIERCTGAGCTSFAQAGTAPANATSYSDETVSGSTTYVYRVLAVSGNGASSPSNTATATTPAACVAPSITSHPQSTTITSGQSATLSAAASGSAPLTYQWYAGTSPVPNATSSSITVTPSTTTTYFVRVMNGCGTQDSNPATVTVSTGSTIQFSPASYTSMEDRGPVFLTVTRTSGNTSGPASVQFTTVNGTATAGARYAATSGTVNFAGGQTSATITIPLVDGTSVEGRQTFTVTLGNASGAELGTPTTASVDVFDDDSASYDFSSAADGQNDILWRNESTGETHVWRMNGTTIASEADVQPLGGNWRFAGASDFNADGHADLLYRNAIDGSLTVWYMNGVTVLGSGSVASTPDLNWKLVAVGDLNRDGYPDLVWRHATTFTMAVWVMRNNVRVSLYTLPSINDANWSVRGLGDFNRDGQLDLVWRHTSGTIAVWYLTPGGASRAGVVALSPTIGAPWELVGVGDLNGDGDADLVWQASTTRGVAIWLMNQTTRSSIVGLPGIPSSSWNVVGPR